MTYPLFLQSHFIKFLSNEQRINRDTESGNVFYSELQSFAALPYKTGEDGIEPSYRAPKARVLPLDDSPVLDRT